MGGESRQKTPGCGREKVKVNFVDLKVQYYSIKNEIDEAIKNVLEKSAFSSGPFVKAFEDHFAELHKSKYCIAVNSGTAALHVAMWAIGIGPGDEVIVPANTFFATPEAVSLCGATPVFVDCEPDYFNIDPGQIKKAINKRTKAILAVHLYGQSARIDAIKDIADRKGLLLLEDCAQAHLTEFHDVPVGSNGICGCFSFYPGKNLGAYGEGGAVLTGDERLFKKIMALRDHGSSKKYYHDYVGHNYRMEGIQGAVLDVKLKHLPEWTERRRKNADIYRKYLAGIENVAVPKEMPNSKHVYHLFVVRVARRDDLKKFLEENGIATGIHYPIPCHLQKAYETLSPKYSMPVSEKTASEILSLPMYAELSENDIQYVCEKISDFYQR
jgi:dTDP-4-amino-4,6-dideoxygalactose transaminase